MRGFLVSAFVASLAVLIFAAPKPASALPAKAALNYSDADAGVVQEIQRYKRGRYNRGRYNRGRYNRGRYRGRYYNRGRYYRPYRYYYGPRYYRPYRYYRPGISIWFGW